MKKIQEIPKSFDSSARESEIYALWEENGFFSPEKSEQILKDSGREIGETFTMTLPPPNANGNPHLGHMCGYSFMDAMGRYNRMKGSPTLLLPGKDHASIQTEAVHTKILAEKGINKWELGREKFYDMTYKFCMNAAQNAQKQERRIGLSADWDRDIFTLDPKLTEVIYDTFYKMYEDGLVYRGKYIINQCPHCRTALADVDTEHKEMRGIFAYILYPFVDEADNDLAEKKLGHRGVMIATTRPETMLADTAVAVNPDDKRYTEFMGKMLKLPIADREIPLIADEDIEIDLGTGALKVTPAHSPIDFQIGKRHELPVINVIDEIGLMGGDIPERFKGLGTIDCSKAIVKELDELGLLDKIENIKHDVSVCERCGTPIEPMISNQWFVNVKPLAEKALEAMDRGDVKIIPEGQQNALRHFYENIEPWCISRQLWWGQRIPVWYSGGKKLFDWLQENPEMNISDWEKESGEEARGSGKVLLAEVQPEGDPDWNGDPAKLWLEAEEDIFDTWFSSGQWPYSTLGGPDGEDFKKFYPTQVMVSARDILFWWEARMIMFGLYRTGKVPFHTVFLHGMIMAEDGSKMSKSKGNGVEPDVVFNKYGADALRLWYYTNALPGSNTPLLEDKIKGNRFFVNKIWNASRFVLTNLDEKELESVHSEIAKLQLIWDEAAESGESAQIDDPMMKENFEHRLKIMDYLDRYKFHLASEGIREFFWGEYCDKWIEEAKSAISGLKAGDEIRTRELGRLIFLLMQNMKIMHPFIPFVTEAVWQELVELGLAEGYLIVEGF